MSRSKSFLFDNRFNMIQTMPSFLTFLLASAFAPSAAFLSTGNALLASRKISSSLYAFKSQTPLPAPLAMPSGLPPGPFLGLEGVTDFSYLEAILKAKVYEVCIESPLTPMSRLSERLGNSVLVKREDMQPVFSFKLRGAYNLISNLPKVWTTTPRAFIFELFKKKFIVHSIYFPQFLG